jgi:RimJ/RimL family protein N-acetyltransferase
MSLTSEQREAARLRDGAEVIIARLTPADAPLLQEAFMRLSEESRRLRFLTPKPNLSSSELRYLTEIDGHRHEALAAIDPKTGRGIAMARFVRDASDSRRAEVAITVADEWQRRGLGKLMLERLVDRARSEGVQSFTALVSADNRNMHGLLSRLEAPVSIEHLADGVAEYQIDLAPRGVGAHLEDALRAAAAGHLQVPPELCDLLRGLVRLRVDPRRVR